jgi:SAM-dependent methyltransferase
MMADLLTLNIPGKINEVRFVGIDLDATVFDLAKALAKQLKVRASCEFFQQDAWDLNVKEKFDLITTNGLNIYEKDDSRVVALYRGMWNALKNQGRLICSALTPPPILTAECEWDMHKINKNDLETSMAIFKIILGATWSNFRSSAKTCEQLREAGFDNIEIYWDQQKMFPTFLAQKQKLQSKL